ncbi:MAG: outer membrane protein assembly factor BamB [Methylococcales bacterium]|nr:outer membrane protein assembly factor BamB [Methylococcales bacterium]
MLKRKPQKYILPLTVLGFSLMLPACASLSNLSDAVQSLGSSILGNNSESEPPAPLTEYDIEVELDVIWKESIGVGKDKKYLKLNIALSSDNIFVADREGLVQARSASNGDLLWESTTSYSFSAGPGLGIDNLILGTSNAEVVAFNRSSGEELWKTTVSSEVLAVPVISKGVVIIRTTDGRIIALNETDGLQLWSFEKNVPALTIRGTGKPLVLDNQVIAGYANGKLLSLDLKTGKNNWETTLAIPSGRSEVERLVDLDSDPVESDGVVYISSYNGGTTAVSIDNGNPLWRNEDLSAYTGLTISRRYIFLSDAKSDVWELEKRNGGTLWKQEALHYRSLTSPIAYDNYVVVGDYDGYVHWLSRTDGRLLNRIKIADAAIDSNPVVVNDIIYIYAKDGTLAALRARLF